MDIVLIHLHIHCPLRIRVLAEEIDTKTNSEASEPMHIPLTLKTD